MLAHFFPRHKVFSGELVYTMWWRTVVVLFVFFSWTADRTVFAFLHSKNYKTQVLRGDTCSGAWIQVVFHLASVTTLGEITVLWEIRMILIWHIFIRGKIALCFYVIVFLSSSKLLWKVQFFILVLPSSSKSYEKNRSKIP